MRASPGGTTIEPTGSPISQGGALMKHMKRLVGPLVLLITLAWTAASAQSLAEIARREKERRAELSSEETKAYTEVDLRSVQSPLGTDAGGAGPDTDQEGAESVSDDAASSEADPRRTETYWRDRLQEVDGRIRDLEEKLESPLYTMNPRGALERQRLERDLEQARRERSELFEEARRAGVPPGWLR